MRAGWCVISGRQASNESQFARGGSTFRSRGEEWAVRMRDFSPKLGSEPPPGPDRQVTPRRCRLGSEPRARGGWAPAPPGGGSRRCNDRCPRGAQLGGKIVGQASVHFPGLGPPAPEPQHRHHSPVCVNGDYLDWADIEGLLGQGDHTELTPAGAESDPGGTECREHRGSGG